MTERYCRKLINEAYNMNKCPNWREISKNGTLSESFIREYWDELNWGLLCRYQKVSENLVREFKDKIKWSDYSASKRMSEKFIEEHINYVDWYWISKYQILSEKFIERWENRIIYFAFDRIPKNISDAFLIKHNKSFSYSFKITYKHRFKKLGIDCWGH